MFKAAITLICCQLSAKAISETRHQPDRAMSHQVKKMVTTIKSKGKINPKTATHQNLPAGRIGIKQANKYRVTKKILIILSILPANFVMKAIIIYFIETLSKSLLCEIAD